MRFQVGVGLAEMVVAEETVAGREGGWVCGCQHQVARTVDEGSFLLRVSSPKDEHQVFAFFSQRADGRVGELLPALPLVRTGLVGAYREGGVEQQDALPGPSGQVAARRHGLAQVVMYFLENVDQRRGEGDAVVDGEAEPVSLSGAMVGVLPDDDDLHAVERAEVEGIEDEPPRRIDCTLLIFLANEVGQLDEIGFVEFRSQMLFPALLDLYIHSVGVVWFCDKHTKKKPNVPYMGVENVRPASGGCVETKNIKHRVTETQRENIISQQNKISVPLCLCFFISF